MKKLLIVLSALALMPACKKDDPAPTSVTLPITTSNVVGVYKITSLKGTPSGTTTTFDMMSSLSACQQDDTHEFTASNNYIRTDAGTTCTPPTPTFTGAYTFTGTTLTYGGNTYTVESITQNGSTVNMVISSTGTINTALGAVTGTVRTTLTR